MATSPQTAAKGRDERKVRRLFLEQRAKELGINLEQIERDAETQARELLSSPDLKVWRYFSKTTRKPHLYAETSDHSRHALCGQEISDGARAQTVDRLRGDECRKCAAQARLIFQRKST